MKHRVVITSHAVLFVGPMAPATTHAMNDEELLSMVEEACFRYYWDAGHPQAGLAPEAASGGSTGMPLRERTKVAPVTVDPV